MKYCRCNNILSLKRECDVKCIHNDKIQQNNHVKTKGEVLKE